MTKLNKVMVEIKFECKNCGKKIVYPLEIQLKNLKKAVQHLGRRGCPHCKSQNLIHLSSDPVN